MLTIRVSGLSRPMSCAGSLFFEDLPPQETSDAAAEGTAAGQLLEEMLKQRSVTPAVASHATNGVAFDADMWFYLPRIAQDILDRAGSNAVLCETRIDWDTSSGIKIKGRYDVSFVKDGVLYIEDLKYGFGIVEPENNWQLLGYAIGECKRLGVGFERIELTVHQPRPYHELGSKRTWVIDYTTLGEKWLQIEERMTAIAGGLKDLTTGKQCKYCPAASVCPAISRSVFQGLDTTLGEWTQETMSEEQISYMMDLLDTALEQTKIKRESLIQLAVSKIKAGKIIPNYTQTETYGDRKWKKEVSPEVLETLTGTKVTELVMLSPAKVEKLGIPKDLVNNMITRDFRGTKLERKDSGAEAAKVFNK